MFLGIRKKYWLFLAATAFIAALLVFVNFSPLFAVRRIQTAGPLANRIAAKQAADSAAGSVFRFDRDRLAKQLLASDRVENVTVTLDLPHTVNAAINDFRPVALLPADRIYGLDRHCRVIPFDTSWESLDLPVLTGLKFDHVFDAPNDFRVANVIAGLTKIRESLPDLHRQIAEIDFSDRVYVIIHLTTGSERFLAHSRDFATQLAKLDAVVNSGTRSDGGCYNLTYENVVIREQ